MAAEHIRRWQVGDVEIVRIVEIFREQIDASFMFPDCSADIVQKHEWLAPRHATADGQIILAFQAFAVRAGDRRIMIDTCIGNDKYRFAPMFHMRHGDFLSDLAAAGFAPEEIDTVLCTHLHLDHVGWNTRLVDGRWVPTFPNARYLMSRVELEFIRNLVGTPHAEVDHLSDSLQPVFDAGLVDFVESDHRVCDAIWLEPTPGMSACVFHRRVAMRSSPETSCTIRCSARSRGCATVSATTMIIAAKPDLRFLSVIRTVT